MKLIMTDLVLNKIIIESHYFVILGFQPDVRELFRPLVVGERMGVIANS